MADKTNTLPRTKKIEKPSPTPSTRRSVKSLLPGLPHKHKKTNSSVSSTKSLSSTGDLESLKDGSDTHSIASTATATSIGSPSSSPLVAKNEKISIKPKSPKPTLKPTVTKTKESKVRKTIVKGGKLLMPKFKQKNESAPIMVETDVDLHRTNRTDDELLTQGHEVGTEADGTLKPTIDVKEVFSNDDWSVKGTRERVQTISQQGTRESIFVEEPVDEKAEEAVDSPNGTVISAESDTLSQASIPSTPSSPNVISVEEGPLNFGKKSPTTLKKEIMQKTNRKVSEGNQYIAAKLERKISLQARPSADKNDLLFKILVIGDLGTGKTSIIKRYVHQFFSQHYRATIGVDFALKVLTWDDNTTIRLQLWDIAGQERFGNMTRVYYKEAVGAFIVFDVTRTSTYDAVLKWKSDLDAKVQLPDGDGIPCVLLANKCDQPKEGAVNSHTKMDEFCRQHKFISWFETSAKENINIDEAAHSLVSAILTNETRKLQEREPSNGSAGIVSINPENGEARSSEEKFCNFC